MKMIPWIPDFLVTLRAEFQHPEPYSIQDQITVDDIHFLQNLGKNTDQFDKNQLKKKLVDGIATGATRLEKRSCTLGTILILIPEAEPWVRIPWESYWRVIRCLSPKKPVKIYLFASTVRRHFPEIGQPIEPEHINGGLAEQCNPQSIVLYRREESLRTLIHELFHTSCSDPNTSIPWVEADCEAWAEIFLCAFAARGIYSRFIKLFQEQMIYALQQSEKARRHHGVGSPDAYAWRYVTGRLVIWERLGFALPELTSNERSRALQRQSLRLTRKSLS